MKNNYLFIIVVAIIVGIVAFFGGMKYQENKTGGGNFSRQFQNMMGNRQGGQNGQGRFGVGAAIGEIISQDDKSITIKMPDGSSKIVILSAQTTYSKNDSTSKTDLKIGGRVAAFGSPNSDGSITAVNIQLNPTLRMEQGRQ